MIIMIIMIIYDNNKNNSMQLCPFQRVYLKNPIPDQYALRRSPGSSGTMLGISLFSLR